MKLYVIAIALMVLASTKIHAAEHLWDMLAETGHGLRDVIFTRSGDKMVLVMQDSIQVRDPESGKVIAKSIFIAAIGHPAVILLPGDSEVVAYDYLQRALVKCNIVRGHISQTIAVDSTIYSLESISDNNKYIITTQQAPFGWYKRWDLTTGKELDSWKCSLTDTAYNKINFDGHTAKMAYLNDSYLCSQDTAYIYGGEWQHVFTGTAHFSSATHERLDSLNHYRLLAVSPDWSKYCYSGEWTEVGSPARLIVWNREDGTYKSLENIVAAKHSTFTFSDDSRYILAWTHSRDSVLVIDAQNPKVIASYGATFAFGAMSRRGIVAVNSLYYLEVFRLGLADSRDESADKVTDAVYNSNNEKVHINWTLNSAPNRVIVSELSGKVLNEHLPFTFYPSQQEVDIDVAGLSAGLYLFSVEDTSKVRSIYKVVINR